MKVLHLVSHGLIKIEKVDIGSEKSAKISIATKKTVTQRWLQIMIMEPKQTTRYNYLFCFFVIMFILCYWYDKKKLELRKPTSRSNEKKNSEEDLNKVGASPAEG